MQTETIVESSGDELASGDQASTAFVLAALCVVWLLFAVVAGRSINKIK